MSELSELIEINKNIEKQNNEIIRLLKKIAGEKESEHEVSFEYVTLDSPYDDVDFKEEAEIESVLEGVREVGEVYFVEDDVFKVSIKNNEIMVDNLTGNGECIDYSLAEIIANESINNNQSLEDSTVILTETTNGKLPQTMKTCIDAGATKAYIPWRQSMELLGAPPQLQSMIEIDLYKTVDHLVEKLFEAEDETEE